jgi:hypothetical protein
VDLRARGGEGFVIHAELGHHAGPKPFDHHVRRFREAHEHFATLGALEVEALKRRLADRRSCAGRIVVRVGVGVVFYALLVPFLMAVGLGVITAVFALLGWRILVQRDVSFQHTRMKHDGVRLSAGTWSLVFVLAWLLLVIDTGVVRYHSAAANVMALSIASFSSR